MGEEEVERRLWQSEAAGWLGVSVSVGDHGHGPGAIPGFRPDIRAREVGRMSRSSGVSGDSEQVYGREGAVASEGRGGAD